MNGTVTKIKHFKKLVTAAGVPKLLFRQCVQHTNHTGTVSSISGIVHVYFTAQFLRANKTLMVWLPIVKTLFWDLAKYSDLFKQ